MVKRDPDGEAHSLSAEAAVKRYAAGASGAKANDGVAPRHPIT